MDIKAKSAAVQDQVFKEDYYVERYNACLKQAGLTKELIERKACSDEKLISFWNTFWWSLPDSPSIRRIPFWSICDLCEEG